MAEKAYFRKITEKLRNNLQHIYSETVSYSVPDLWLPNADLSAKRSVVNVQPADFFLRVIDSIAQQKSISLQRNHGGRWTQHAVIYNMFVRTTCAFDHNQNGKLDLPLNRDGWRETGSFLKAMTLIPYVKSMGVNTIHLLPITSIGSDGNKGTLGSPYAIRNPYKLDSNLHEPNAGLGVEEEFRLFVQAAHHLGIRVVVEFVFRTTAKDGDWVKEHPEWYYWIREKIKDRRSSSHEETHYGNPIFTEDELKQILADVENANFENLIPPHRVYREMFTQPPKRETIHLEKGRYIGMMANGTRVRIPGAFADWPPHDTQPLWSDVTYLKMYDHPDFNYAAYNTLRMYDSRLAQKENVNEELWETIAEIIPHYQHTFGIDGVMIDMGHALPMDLKQEMIRRAREINPDFTFWDENFSVTEKSIEQGYNAVIGYQWSDQHQPEKFRNMLKRFAREGFPLPYFATAESHNTPRAAAREGGITYSKYAWTVSNFLPAIPFVHSGFELGETYPINTGLDFKKEELAKLPSEKLPLFSEYAYDWLRDNNLIGWIRTVSAIRLKYQSLIENPSPRSFVLLDTDNLDVFAFMRINNGKKKLLVIANSCMTQPVEFSTELPVRKKSLIDLLSSAGFSLMSGVLSGRLDPGQVAVFDMS